jgi:hypothetical protein
MQQQVDRSLQRQPSLSWVDGGPRLISPQSDEAERIGYGTPPYNISRRPEDRREPGPGHLSVFVKIQEVKHPAPEESSPLEADAPGWSADL